MCMVNIEQQGKVSSERRKNSLATFENSSTVPGRSLLVLLDELGVLEVLLGEAGGELGDEDAGDGEAGEEGPVAAPLPAEEHRPRVEGLHLRSLSSSLGSP